jgi:hypothetical protein
MKQSVHLPSMEEKRSAFSKFKDKITPAFLKPWVQIVREEGFKALVKKKGWKVVAAVFLFYLVRDSILYLLIPYLIARGFIQ